MFRHLSYILVLVASTFAVACSGGSGGYGTSPAPTQPAAVAPGGATTGTAPATAGVVDVVIQNMAFSPQTITIPAGTTVRWTQKDSVPHNVTSDKGSFSSGTLSQGQTFSYKFTTAGSYSYTCTIHPNMTATVIVQ